MIEKRWVVIVIDGKGKFDCVLDNKLFDSSLSANNAIKEAMAEDEDRDWLYSYVSMWVSFKALAYTAWLICPRRAGDGRRARRR